MRGRRRSALDLVFLGVAGAAGLAVLGLALALVGILYNGASPSIRAFGFRFLLGGVWNPSANVYGDLPFVYGTLLTSALGLLIAVPLAVGASIFLTTQAPRALRQPVGTAIELLAAVPSVVYGFWGLFVLAPFMALTVDPLLRRYLGWTGWFTGPAIGTGVLTSSVILAVMVVPTITAVSRDTLGAVPAAQREAALSLGATQWETTRYSMLPYARIGIVGGIVLGLGRAIGETMAVTMTIGNSDVIPTSLFSQGQTLASLVANELLNLCSSSSCNTTLERSAILEAGLVLLAISLLVNVLARLLVWKVLRVQGGAVE